MTDEEIKTSIKEIKDVLTAIVVSLESSGLVSIGWAEYETVKKWNEEE